MSFLKDSSISIYEAMMHIKEGRYVMPAFQRQFVWSMEQIEKLWDSILLNYPKGVQIEELNGTLTININ